MQKVNAVYFDMDGTFVDLYGVYDWQHKITHGDVSPYLKADPLVSIKQLKKLLKMLHNKHVHTGVLSWGAKGSDLAFLKRTKQAKIDWINGYGLDFDSIKVMPYGRKKHAYALQESFLVDDSPIVRKQWHEQGMCAFDGGNAAWIDELLTVCEVL